MTVVEPAKFWSEAPEVGVRFAPALWPGGNANLVALASYPRSGNSLLRTLLERLTGVWTGSIYQVSSAGPLKVARRPAAGRSNSSTHNSRPRHHATTSALGLPAERVGLEGRRLLPPRGRRRVCEDARSDVP